MGIFVRPQYGDIFVQPRLTRQHTNPNVCGVMFERCVWTGGELCGARRVPWMPMGKGERERGGREAPLEIRLAELILLMKPQPWPRSVYLPFKGSNRTEWEHGKQIRLLLSRRHTYTKEYAHPQRQMLTREMTEHGIIGNSNFGRSRVRPGLTVGGGRHFLVSYATIPQ